MSYRMSDMSLPGSKVIRIYDNENNQIVIPQIEKGKHYGISQVPETKKFVEEVMTRLNNYNNLKDKLRKRNMRIKKLKIKFETLQSNVRVYVSDRDVLNKLGVLNR